MSEYQHHPDADAFVIVKGSVHDAEEAVLLHGASVVEYHRLDGMTVSCDIKFAPEHEGMRCQRLNAWYLEVTGIPRGEVGYQPGTLLWWSPLLNGETQTADPASASEVASV